MADTGDEKFFFNLETGQVEKGKVSAWDKRWAHTTHKRKLSKLSKQLKNVPLSLIHI